MPSLDPWAPLRQVAPRLGLAWSKALQEQLHLYLTTLQTWNRRFNLTGEDEPGLLVQRHFLDSLTALPLLDPCTAGWPEPTLIDVGTGAGFPGLILQIARPAWRVTLLEANRKRVQFLRHLCYELGLKEVPILAGRAEAVGHDPGFRERFHIALARAVADLRVLVEYGLPLVQIGGYFVAYKGATAAQEAEAAQEAIALLGGGPPQIRTVDLTWEGQPWPGRFIQIAKLQPSPPRYPRRPGRPSRGARPHPP